MKDCEKEVKNTAKDFEKRANAWGERIEKEWGEGHKGKITEYVANIVINTILIYVWGNLVQWLPFLTDEFYKVLRLFYISFALTILANVLFLVYDGRVFKHLIKFGLNAFSIYVMVTIYKIFPFDFSTYSGDWNQIVRILLVLAIFGTAIGSLVELLKSIFPSKQNNKKQ